MAPDLFFCASAADWPMYCVAAVEYRLFSSSTVDSRDSGLYCIAERVFVDLADLCGEACLLACLTSSSSVPQHHHVYGCAETNSRKYSCTVPLFSFLLKCKSGRGISGDFLSRVANYEAFLVVSFRCLLHALISSVVFPEDQRLGVTWLSCILRCYWTLNSTC